MLERRTLRALSYGATAVGALLAFIAAGDVVPQSPGAPPPSPSAIKATLESARAQLVDHLADVKTRTSSATDLVSRLNADIAAVTAASEPDALQSIALVAQLDESLSTQLVSGSYLPAPQHGAGSVLFLASADKTMQPMAVYVPSTYNAKRAAPLIIMLHGQGQTESELLATAYLQRLADESGAIFAVPYARGDDETSPTAASDVDDAASWLMKTYTIDPRQVYLSGYSLGGIAIFLIAPVRPNQWNALLSIAGTLTNQDKDSAARALRGKSIFFVAGENDPYIKAQYVHAASEFLAAGGANSHYYEQPNGMHSLVSLQPAAQQAWRAMFTEVRNVAPNPSVAAATPMPSRRY